MSELITALGTIAASTLIWAALAYALYDTTRSRPFGGLTYEDLAPPATSSIHMVGDTLYEVRWDTDHGLQVEVLTEE